MERADVIPLKRVVAMVRLLQGKGRIRDAALVAVAGGFGLRIGDALNITWGDVCDGHRIRSEVIVKERKNRRTRIVAVLPWVREVLEEYLEASRPVDPDEKLFPVTRVRAWQIVKETAAEMGLAGRISPHSLRKAFCDAVFEATRDPVLTARITGHANPAQLLHYIGRHPETEKHVWRRLATLKL